ncbi:MAG: M15 family metallopeptidase [Eubacteriales bacterium]|nr:M15 family metallopeptidase [Eubacteriales bacterium]
MSTPIVLRADATTSPEATPLPTATVTQSAQPESAQQPSEFVAVDVARRIRENLQTDLPTLRLISTGTAIFLYPEPTKKSTKIKLRNVSTKHISELIILSEVTSPEGAAFYQVKSTFSGDVGYVLVRDAHNSKLAKTGVSGYARIEAANCDLLADSREKSEVLATECEHLVRILGEMEGYYYVITEAGNFGYVLPSQLVRIDEAEVLARIARAEAPAVQETMSDPMREPSAANAAKMLRAGTDSAAVHYWTTAEAHIATQGFLKKATIAMLSASAGSGLMPVGYEGIQFQSCPEVPIIHEGDTLQQGLDYNLHGSIYSDSALTSVTAEIASTSGDGASVKQSVSFLPEQSITAYSLTSKTLDSLDKKFDVRALRAGQYRFTLSATSISQPEPVVLVSAACNIAVYKPHTLTQNKFDDNYQDALEFFRGDTSSFLFPYYISGGRGIGIDVAWRNAHIVRSSLGRVHVNAVPYFEAANHYLENTYVRVSLLNRHSGKTLEGKIMLLDDLVAKHGTFVPRFQTNLDYISHHALGTAIDVNDNLYPNSNLLSNHDLIGGDVRNHLTYNGIKTDASGIQYYDFTYDGTYPARYQMVPNTIVNYLLYDLAFYRAGFEWGFYYETTCDAMHFMLTENDRNRHMHTDIGLRKVYDYIDPEWVYVPTPSPSPAPLLTPKLGMTPLPAATPTPTPTPKK